MKFSAYTELKEKTNEISIRSCGHIFAKKGRAIDRPKGSGDFLLFYIAKGKEEFDIFGQRLSGEEGAFIIFRPDDPQKHICTSTGTSEFYYVSFIAPEDYDISGFESSHIYSGKHSAGISELFEEILSEIQMKNNSYHELCVYKLFEILILLKRRNESLCNPNSEYMDKIAFIVQLIHKEYNAPHTLSDYAQMCSMSKFHFLRIFESVTGKSPIEYRNDIRLEHAKEFLSDTSVPIGEIAARVGYSSSAYFCDAFKKKAGISPIKYRKESKEQ